ncbi:MAG: hypothetical protein U0599_09375 [Vicinamibacteria bacterium]
MADEEGGAPDPGAAVRLGRFGRVMRPLWMGANAVAFALAMWHWTLPPGPDRDADLLMPLVWGVLLFPGVFAMLAAIAALRTVTTAWMDSPLGFVLFFGIWAMGWWLSYRFWFRWMPKRRAAKAGRSSLSLGD